MKVLVTQPCLTLYDPMDHSQPGSSIQGILQARRLEWVASPSSRGSSQPRNRVQISCTAGRFFSLSELPDMISNSDPPSKLAGKLRRNREASTRRLWDSRSPSLQAEFSLPTMGPCQPPGVSNYSETGSTFWISKTTDTSHKSQRPFDL